LQRLLRRACGGGSDPACLELKATRKIQEKADLVVAALADMAQRNKKTGTTGEPLRVVLHRCGEGDGAACAEAALRYEEGKGVAKDARQGHRFHRLACALGYWFSCNNLTLMYEDSLGEKISRRMFRRMCDGGSAYGCYWIAARLMTGLGGLPRRPKQGEALMVKACHGGHGPACHDLAMGQPDEAKRRALLQRGCEGGCPDSCKAVKREAEARANLAAARKACLGEQAAGCHAAALSLSQLGGAPRLARAAAYLTKACQMKHGPACAELGRAHAAGSGVKQDRARAAALYGQACDLGHAAGCTELASALDRGEGIEEDTPRAMKLHARVCDAGHLASCHSLGELHLDPDAEGRQPAHGARLLLRACKGERYDACDALVTRTGRKGVSYAQVLAALKKMHRASRDDLVVRYSLHQLAYALGNPKPESYETNHHARISKDCRARKPGACAVKRLVHKIREGR